MNEELLRRLVEAMEGIKDELGSISSSLADSSVTLNSLEKDIEGCISVSGKSQYLCIAGDVNTY